MTDINGVGIKNNTFDPGSINHIIDHFATNGAQRANRYAVRFIDLPASIAATEETSFFATMVQVPQRTINYFSDSVGPFSPYWDIPLKQEFDDHFIINFLIDKKWNIRKLIDSWMDIVVGTNYGFGLGYTNGRSAEQANLQPANNGTFSTYSKIEIQAIATDNTTPYKIILHQAWPKLILPTQYDTNALNMPLMMSVDFSYRYYTTE